MTTKAMCFDNVPAPPIKTIHNIEEHFDIPNVLVCFRTSSKKNGCDNPDAKKRDEKRKSGKSLKASKSRELRASILYRGCDCERRDGLQDQCQRSECRGSPECLTVPPTCPPSQFANGKHLQKMYEQRLKEIEAARKRLVEKARDKYNENGKHGAEAAAASSAAAYECYPLELLRAGDNCPICEMPMHREPKEHRHQQGIQVGPVHITLPNDCICCHPRNDAKAKCGSGHK